MYLVFRLCLAREGKTYLTNSACHLLQFVRTDIRTECEAEVNQGKLAKQVLIGEGVAILIK